MKNFIKISIAKRLILVSLPLLSLSFQSTAVAHVNTHEHPATMSHMNHSAASRKQASQPTMKLSVSQIIKKEGKEIVLIKLTDIKDNKPVTLDDLKEVHTQKIHLLIIDDTLTDYNHVHPQATPEPGIYQFEWSPVRKNVTYRAWADLMPKPTKVQEYIIVDLKTAKNTAVNIARQVSNESTVDGYRFKLSFDQTQLEVGKAAMGKITITDAKGNPVRSLEPVMGAYAHIVGFNDDFKTVVHIHPMGKEPTKSSDRGGPELQFHLEPEKAGFIKMFAQVKINGKEFFAPFGIIVRKKGAAEEQITVHSKAISHAEHRNAHL